MNIKYIIQQNVFTITDPTEAYLCGAKDANFEGYVFIHKNLHGVNFEGANLKSSSFRFINLSGANLEGANLEGSTFKSVNLSDANLSNANCKDMIFIDMSYIISRTNLYIENSSANLSGVNFSGANLSGVNFRGMNLEGANFTNANLTNVDLRGSDLSKCIFRGANLTNTNISVFYVANIYNNTEVTYFTLKMLLEDPDLIIKNTKTGSSDFKNTDVKRIITDNEKLKRLQIKQCWFELYTSLGKKLSAMEISRIIAYILSLNERRTVWALGWCLKWKYMQLIH